MVKILEIMKQVIDALAEPNSALHVVFDNNQRLWFYVRNLYGENISNNEKGIDALAEPNSALHVVFDNNQILLFYVRNWKR